MATGDTKITAIVRALQTAIDATEARIERLSESESDASAEAQAEQEERLEALQTALDALSDYTA